MLTLPVPGRFPPNKEKPTPPHNKETPENPPSPSKPPPPTPDRSPSFSFYAPSFLSLMRRFSFCGNGGPCGRRHTVPPLFFPHAASLPSRFAYPEELEYAPLTSRFSFFFGGSPPFFFFADHPIDRKKFSFRAGTAPFYMPLLPFPASPCLSPSRRLLPPMTMKLHLFSRNMPCLLSPSLRAC